MYGFSSERKMASVLVRRPDGTLRLYTKGAAEIVLGHSVASVGASGQAAPLGDAQREELEQSVTEMASRGLRTLCLAYRGGRGCTGPLRRRCPRPGLGRALPASTPLAPPPFAAPLQQHFRKCPPLLVIISFFPACADFPAVDASRPDDYFTKPHEQELTALCIVAIKVRAQHNTACKLLEQDLMALCIGAIKVSTAWHSTACNAHIVHITHSSYASRPSRRGHSTARLLEPS